METVAIIGRGRTRRYIQYVEGVDYWAFNDNARTIPEQYLSGMFEMHPDWQTRYNGIIGCEGYSEWLMQPHTFPIWMHDADPLIPASRKYPMGEDTFFTSTTPYALALAISSGYKIIQMWGIEADPGGEYAQARDAIFYWMGKARGAGIRIDLHPENQLFKAKLYPFGYDKIK